MDVVKPAYLGYSLRPAVTRGSQLRFDSKSVVTSGASNSWTASVMPDISHGLQARKEPLCGASYPLLSKQLTQFPRRLSSPRPLLNILTECLARVNQKGHRMLGTVAICQRPTEDCPAVRTDQETGPEAARWPPERGFLLSPGRSGNQRPRNSPRRATRPLGGVAVAQACRCRLPVSLIR